jgi:hypothetical protein
VNYLVGSMVAICSVCGEENLDEATVCRACGAPLRTAPPAKRVTSEKIYISIFVIALLIIAAIIIAPFVYNNSSNGNHKEDSDGDGMPDEWEEAHGLNPDNPNDRTQDLDSDGLQNYEEYLRDTDPQDPDTDADGVLDGLDLIPLHDAGIEICIDQLRIWDPVDGLLEGNINDPAEIFFEVYVDGGLVGELPADAPAEVTIDVLTELNWSMTVNVSDDRSHEVRLQLYDDDALGRDQLDINGLDDRDKGLSINYYLGTETIGRSLTGEGDGHLDGNDAGLQDEKDALVTYTFTTVDVRL